MAEPSDTFTLYDLRVEVVAGNRPMVCNHRAGDFFELSGENLSFPPGQTFPLYPLAALLPLLPAKQRETHPNDWMTTDTDIACPDPNCGAVFRISRTGRRSFRHGEVTVTPLPGPSGTGPGHHVPDPGGVDVPRTERNPTLSEAKGARGAFEQRPQEHLPRRRPPGAGQLRKSESS